MAVPAVVYHPHRHLCLLLLLLLLSLLLGIHATTSPSPSPSVYSTWLHESGASLHQLSVSESGVLATEDLEEGEAFLTVPLSGVFSSLMTRNHPTLGPSLQSASLTPLEEVVIAILHARSDPSSPLQPFAWALPTQPDVPVFWPEDDWETLDSNTRHLVLARQQALKNAATRIQAAIQESEGSFEEVSNMTVEGLLSVCTSFGVEADDGAILLIPLMELMEQEPAEQMTSFEVGDDGFVRLFLHSPVQKGEKIRISLGVRRSSEFLVHYGWAPLPNPMDFVEIMITLNDHDPFADIRSRTLLHHEMHPNETFVITRNGIPKRLLRRLRVQYVRMSEFDKVERAFQDVPISLENELESMRQLVALFSLAMQEHDTTREEDVNRYEDPSTPRHHRFALAVRINQRDILQQSVDILAGMWLKFLETGYD